MSEENRNYKNSLFTSYFKDKARLIDAYNAISGEHYSKDVKLEFNTLQNVFIGKQFNDISFTIDDKFVVLIEHQSSINANMPLRILMYCSRVYENIIDRKTLYKQRIQRIPCPKFYVIYNGTDVYPDVVELKLSDAFSVEEKNPALELIVPVYNISEGHNAEILKQSKALADYAAFVNHVNGYIARGNTREDAIKMTIRYCLNNGIMKPYLGSNESEATNMLITEWDMDECLEARAEEAMEEGLIKGREEGLEKGITSTAVNMKKEGLNVDLISKVTGLSADAIGNL